MSRLYRAMLSFALVLAAAGILLAVVLFGRVSDQQNSLQQSRVDITYQNCDEQNDRHDKAFNKLGELIAGLPPRRRARAKEGEAGTKALIETIAPKQNCLRLVQRRFGDTPRPSVLEHTRKKPAVHPGS